MATGPEKKVTDKVLKELNSRPGHLFYKVHQGRYGGGQPDIDGVVYGRSVKIEMKAPGNEPTARQMLVMRRWAKVGALVGWATSLEEVEELLSHLDDPDWVNPQLAP